MKVYEGKLDGRGLRIAIIVSRFNELINSKLLSGARDCLLRHGVLDVDISVYWVPGAFEIPVVASKICEKSEFDMEDGTAVDAVIALGTVIRGATPHFNYVSSEVSKGIAQVSLEYGIPVTFGVLTTDSIEQAIERAGTKAGNKGWDAAQTALEMVNLFKEME